MNSKIANNTDGVVKHPPLFVWYQMVKERLQWTDTGSTMAEVGNPNLYSYTASTKRKKTETLRINLMLNLKNHLISLPKYLLAFGTSIDNKDTDEMIEDIEDELEKEEALAKAAEPTPQKAGKHSKVSNNKYKNVNGQLSTTNMEEPEPTVIPVAETPKQKKAKKKLSMEMDEKAANIIQSRYNNDIDSLLSDGFNLSDVGMNDAPKPPKDKLLLNEKAHYLAWRLRSLKMEVSTTYEDLEDGKM